uniref:Uncharacterized protein n=1 Tax=Strongyloides papillosus TaxID=174720 RepID=A0A0N5B8W7_STREA
MNIYYFLVFDIFHLVLVSKIKGADKYDFPIFQSDECDKGYLKFFVDIQRPPEGTWFCGKFCVTDGKCQKCSSILVEKKTPSRGRPSRKPVAPVEEIVQTISGMCDECTEKCI